MYSARNGLLERLFWVLFCSDAPRNGGIRAKDDTLIMPILSIEHDWELMLLSFGNQTATLHLLEGR